MSRRFFYRLVKIILLKLRALNVKLPAFVFLITFYIMKGSNTTRGLKEPRAAGP